MPRPYRKNNNLDQNHADGEDVSSSNTRTGPKTTVQMMLGIIGVLLVVVGVGFSSFSGSLQSCFAESMMSSTLSTTIHTETQGGGTCKENSPNLMWDSTNATVMGYATGYPIVTYKKFVGSLRNSGFKGNIILALAPDVEDKIVEYLTSRNVIMHRVEYTTCTHELIGGGGVDEKELQSCLAPYAHLKARWGRFPLYKDYLQACSTCTGPVLVTDVRDVFFQKDPFGSGDPYPTGLQVFQEHAKQTTTSHWLVDDIIRKCKGSNDPLLGRNLPHLCSGTTIGTRQAMLNYLDIMHEEMKVWMDTPSCRFKISSDDQSIHNYLYYNGKLPFAESIPNRAGIVHTIGYQAAQVWVLHDAFQKAFPQETPETVALAPMRQIKIRSQKWIQSQFDLTDEEGFITNFDNTRSRVVHHYDRFGMYCDWWFSMFSGLPDS